MATIEMCLPSPYRTASFSKQTHVLVLMCVSCVIFDTKKTQAETVDDDELETAAAQVTGNGQTLCNTIYRSSSGAPTIGLKYDCPKPRVWFVLACIVCFVLTVHSV